MHNFSFKKKYALLIVGLWFVDAHATSPQRLLRRAIKQHDVCKVQDAIDLGAEVNQEIIILALKEVEYTRKQLDTSFTKGSLGAVVGGCGLVATLKKIWFTYSDYILITQVLFDKIREEIEQIGHQQSNQSIPIRSEDCPAYGDHEQSADTSNYSRVDPALEKDEAGPPRMMLPSIELWHEQLCELNKRYNNIFNMKEHIYHNKDTGLSQIMEQGFYTAYHNLKHPDNAYWVNNSYLIKSMFYWPMITGLASSSLILVTWFYVYRKRRTYKNAWEIAKFILTQPGVEISSEIKQKYSGVLHKMRIGFDF